MDGGRGRDNREGSQQENVAIEGRGDDRHSLHFLCEK